MQASTGSMPRKSTDNITPIDQVSTSRLWPFAVSNSTSSAI